jgi:exopolysaccharide biosynthesis polyprenyl glycosylphosphotransferase
VSTHSPQQLGLIRVRDTRGAQARIDPLPAAPQRWTARDPLRRRLLALADAGAVLAAAGSFVFLGAGGGAAFAALVSLPLWILIAKLYGLYDRDHGALRHLTVDELPSILAWTGTSIAALVVFLHATSLVGISIQAAANAVVAAFAAALVLRSLARYAWRRITPPERILIVGSKEHAQSVRRKLELFADIHGAIVGEYSAPRLEPLREGRAPWLSPIDRLILAAPSLDDDLFAHLVAVCRAEHVKLSVVPADREIFGSAGQLHHVADLPVVDYNTWDVSRSTLLLKRVLDIVLAAALLLVTLPVIAITVVAVRLGGSGPAFYVQTRAGLHGREFRMLKFRTMRADAETILPALVQLDALDEPVFKLVRDPRVTRLGRVLRRTSLDELPQLLNVLKGDMSLVGPRPEQVELVRRYEPDHLFRLTVKPGLTGPMQVFGRGRLSFEERLALERDYIENLSIGRDLRILAMTVGSVLEGRGAY